MRTRLRFMAEQYGTYNHVLGADHPEEVRWNLERISRERLLPRVEILEKVARYETHLSRRL